MTPSSSVPLTRRSVVDDFCTMLVPGPITNSGRADGCWMDKDGLILDVYTAIKCRPGIPVDCFTSNDAYAKEGFTKLSVQLHPPLEDATRESLTDYMKTFAYETENIQYQFGNYRDIPLRRIDNPRVDLPGCTADAIVHMAFEVQVAGLSPYLSPDLTSTTCIAVLYFAKKGMVLFKANNFERHDPPLDYETILGSIAYKAEKGMYRGQDPEIPQDPLEEQGFGIRHHHPAHIVPTAHFNPTTASSRHTSDKSLDNCFHCSATSTPKGRQLLVCSRCKKAVYCTAKCQKKDWKRHKKSECAVAIT